MTALGTSQDLLATLNEIDQRGRERLGELLDVLDREGGNYLRSCAEKALTGPANGPSPKKPAALPLEWARGIREIAMDLTTETRLYGRRPSQRATVEQSLIADEQRAHHRDVYPARSRA